MCCSKITDIWENGEHLALDAMVCATLLSITSLVVSVTGSHEFDPEGIILAHSFIAIFLATLTFLRWKKSTSHWLYLPHAVVFFLFGFVFGEHRNEYVAVEIILSLSFVLHASVFTGLVSVHHEECNVRLLAEHEERSASMAPIAESP